MTKLRLGAVVGFNSLYRRSPLAIRVRWGASSDTWLGARADSTGYGGVLLSGYLRTLFSFRVLLLLARWANESEKDGPILIRRNINVSKQSVEMKSGLNNLLHTSNPTRVYHTCFCRNAFANASLDQARLNESPRHSRSKAHKHIQKTTSYDVFYMHCAVWMRRTEESAFL